MIDLDTPKTIGDDRLHILNSLLPRSGRVSVSVHRAGSVEAVRAMVGPSISSRRVLVVQFGEDVAH